MELRHLRYFVALAGELHFTRAAESLNISTPTLTVQIQEIERRLGTPLFLRSRRTVSLTDAGAIFLREAKDVLARFDRAESVGRRAAIGQIGRLQIGYVGSAVYANVLQREITQFRRNHPSVDVYTSERTMDDIPALVLSGSIDAGIVRLPMALPKTLRTHVLLIDHFCLAVHADHELARQSDDPRPQQLAMEPFVVPEQLAGTYEIARRGNFTPNIVSRPGSIFAVIAEVSLGTGVAIVPDSICEVLKIPSVSYRRISGRRFASSIGAILPPDPGVIAALFAANLTVVAD